MWIVLWLALSVIAGIIASNKGRSFFGFLLLAILLSPLIGILAAAIAKPNALVQENAAILAGHSRRCPHCAEIIKTQANICRHCGKEVEPVTKQACQHCGYQDIPPGEKYCLMCFRRLT